MPGHQALIHRYMRLSPGSLCRHSDSHESAAWRLGVVEVGDCRVALRGERGTRGGSTLIPSLHGENIGTSGLDLQENKWSASYSVV